MVTWQGGMPCVNIVVLSGKGGVGKTTLSGNLALALANHGSRVGLLDTDLCHPNIHLLLKMEKENVYQGKEGWMPIERKIGKGSLQVMSLGFLVKKDAIILRGPKKKMLLETFLEGVVWGELDYLVVDTSPGTGEETRWIIEKLKKKGKTGGVVVTTSQSICVDDCRRMLGLCQQSSLEMIGVIENMAGYSCEHCGKITNVFSKRGGEYFAEENSLTFLGSIPIKCFVSNLSSWRGEIVEEFQLLLNEIARWKKGMESK